MSPYDSACNSYALGTELRNSSYRLEIRKVETHFGLRVAPSLFERSF